MDNQVHARIAQMRDSAANIKAGAMKIEGAVAQTDKEISALGPDVYQSPGAESFRANYARLTPVLLDAAKQLNDFQQRLAVAADEIEHAAGSTL